ncbi:MAG: hypothetical protein QF365_03105 [Candidatus Thalassarchaeaceae archaeon]|nr:hypothetical protein [Candidatus Thalassarchaeaceae archaeon]MDP6318662.1 hypothetical protein [Candidatus Thalassarchaeaceae archaeon]HIH80565.1 hypothetical protein [Candidatus Thalassarchaeaceae archaeon]HJN70422.1 hypothetical protein [Candidatus Thalassarchaeaceae archaeon]
MKFGIRVAKPWRWGWIFGVILLKFLGFRLFSYSHLQDGGETACPDHEDQGGKVYVRIPVHQTPIIVICMISDLGS